MGEVGWITGTLLETGRRTILIMWFEPSLLLLLLLFMTGSCSIAPRTWNPVAASRMLMAKNDFELQIILLLFPMYRDYSFVTPCLVLSYFLLSHQYFSWISVSYALTKFWISKLFGLSEILKTIFKKLLLELGDGDDGSDNPSSWRKVLLVQGHPKGSVRLA